MPSGTLLPFLEPSFPGGSFLSDHPLPPEETVRRLWPHLESLGITRLARQTGLDRLGLPVWAAFRPNSKSLAGSQGKGLTDAAACASAAMEATEVAVAERPIGEIRLASANELTDAAERWFDPERYLRFGIALDRDVVASWIRGTDLHNNSTVWLPLDAVDMDGERSDFAHIAKSSNGLASGVAYSDAIFHAICELIERDGTTLWTLLPKDRREARCFAASDLGNAEVDELAARIAVTGLRLGLFDQTSNIGIPAVMAVLGPTDARNASQLEITAGYGAHPEAALATIRAITEAAQSRVTAIAASRDDIHTASFETPASEENRALLCVQPLAEAPKSAATASRQWGPDQLLGRLREVGCRVFATTLSSSNSPFCVVRALSPDLEDRGANINWRPGSRSFDVLERLEWL